MTRDDMEARRIKKKECISEIKLNSMDKFDIHDLLSFDLYFTIVINQLKFETTIFERRNIIGKFTISIVLL